MKNLRIYLDTSVQAKNSSALPKALRDVWDWKDAIYRENEGLALSEALQQIHRDVAAIRKEFAFHVAAPQSRVPHVAETAGSYGEQ